MIPCLLGTFCCHSAHKAKVQPLRTHVLVSFEIRSFLLGTHGVPHSLALSIPPRIVRLSEEIQGYGQHTDAKEDAVPASVLGAVGLFVNVGTDYYRYPGL